MNKHTPGPWYSKGSVIGAKPRLVIAHVSSVCEEVDEQANARLIAAAPDLLETLRDIVGMLTDANDMRADALHAARTAIMRATGG